MADPAEPASALALPASIEPPDAWCAAAGALAGFAMLAVVDAAAVIATVPMLGRGVGLRAASLGFDAAETLGLGLFAAALAAALEGRARLPVWASGLVHAAVTAPFMYAALAGDLDRQATAVLEGRLEPLLFPLYVVLVSLAIPAAWIMGRMFAPRPRLRWAPVVVSLGAMVADQLILADDYFGLHATVAWTAATLAGAALTGAVGPLAAWVRSAAAGRVLAVALALLGLAGLLVPPPNAVRIELFRQPCATAPWVLATALWGPPPIAAAAGEKVEPPRARADVAPTEPRPWSKAPVVVMITVDALRGEVVNDGKNDGLLPTLAEMKRRGTWFPNATSAGSQTAVSLTAVFSGRYFSELFWAMHGTGLSRFAYAADDPSPRFPTLLGQRGVKSEIFCSINFLADEFGVARGFSHERVIPSGREHAHARQVIGPLIEALRRAGDEPLFLYTHLMEPHAPYDRGRKDGTDYERYVSEVAIADAAIGRVARVLEQRFPDRGVLIVSADHGEAFGEHGTFQHTKTLYDELLHVPLLVSGPKIAARKVEQRVGLIDLGPTILDVFGATTPRSFEGQSLLPLLLGREATLSRPILAEGRLRRALYTADGLEVIEDSRRKTVEVFDTVKDPGELSNLFGVDPRGAGAVRRLRAFYDENAARRPGYQPPYKP